MTEMQELRFLYLPDDILRVISEYCGLTSRCAVTCTNSAVPNPGSLRKFTLRMTQFRSIHLQVNIKEIEYERHIVILNSVRSVFLYDAKIKDSVEFSMGESAASNSNVDVAEFMQHLVFRIIGTRWSHELNIRW